MNHFCGRCRGLLNGPYDHCHHYGCGWRNPRYSLGYGGNVVDSVLAAEEAVAFATGDVRDGFAIAEERDLLAGDLGGFVADVIAEEIFDDSNGW